MTFEYGILLPPTALAFLTGFVWLRMGSDRLGELRSRRIHPQQVATTLLLLACAWGYVALRAAHAYIHLSHNKVVRRFQTFVASTIVLYVMWGIFAVRLVMAG
jgi:hypothetical protein